MEPGAAEEVVAMLPIAVRDVDSEEARPAARLRPKTRAAGLSLGDRACLARAIASGGTAVTANRTWAGLDLEITVQMVR